MTHLKKHKRHIKIDINTLMKINGGAQQKQTLVSGLGLWAVRLQRLQPLLQLLLLQQHTKHIHVHGELRPEWLSSSSGYHKVIWWIMGALTGAEHLKGYVSAVISGAWWLTGEICLIGFLWDKGSNKKESKRRLSSTKQNIQRAHWRITVVLNNRCIFCSAISLLYFVASLSK